MKKVVAIEDIAQVKGSLDPAVLDYIRDGQIETFESFANFDVAAFDWYDIWGPEAEEPAQILVYIDHEDVFFLCENERAMQKAQALFKESESNERTLYEFFLGLIKSDQKHVEQMEERIAQIEERILKGVSDEGTEQILDFRSEVLRLKKYYEQLDGIFDGMCDNDNGLLSPACLRWFANLTHRVERLLSGVINLRDYATQVREAYQAQIDIQQNSLMKIFTVITSVFLPLTLIVGWYGMNFDMPELRWKYGYLMVIVASVFVCVACFMIFKKKKWF